MLSRVADSLYWMSRYLERAEHTARLVDVNLQMIDQGSHSSEHRWMRLLASLQAERPGGKRSDAYTIVNGLAFDAANPASIVGSIALARENARQVREQISSEMWEQLNRLYLEARQTRMAEIWAGEPHRFFQSVKEGAQLFQGITDATMSHGEGWRFIEIGRFIERAQATAVLLDANISAVIAEGDAYDYFEWVGLLKSFTAFEAYCKVYTADVQPERLVEFLLLNAEFPHSMRFAADRVHASLQAIGRSTATRNAARAERLSGRLRAAIDYGQIDEIMADMHAYLETVQRQCAQLHTAIHQIYFAYSIETALAQ